MAARTRSSAKGQEEEARIPVAVQPPATGYALHGGLDAGFVWQQLADIQKTLGAMDAKLEQGRQVAEKMESELGKIKSDVAEFKQIRYTAKVLIWLVGLFMALAGFFAKEAWHVFKPGGV